MLNQIAFMTDKEKKACAMSYAKLWPKSVCKKG